MSRAKCLSDESSNNSFQKIGIYSHTRKRERERNRVWYLITFSRRKTACILHVKDYFKNVELTAIPSLRSFRLGISKLKKRPDLTLRIPRVMCAY